MSEYHFGTGRGRVLNRRRIEKIASDNGATFVNVNLPGEGWRYWFSAPNLGHPFDSATRDRVLVALDRAGLTEDDGTIRVGLR